MKRIWFHPEFPTSGCILLGLGLGGLTDGIVLQQLLQWRQLFSSSGSSSATLHGAGFPEVIQAISLLLVVHGLVALWRMARTVHLIWSTRLILGALLIGVGGYFVAKGLLSFLVQGLRQLNGPLLSSQWFYWELCLFVFATGVACMGWRLLKQGESISFAFVHRDQEPRCHVSGSIM